MLTLWFRGLDNAHIMKLGLDNAHIMVLVIRQCSHYGAGDYTMLTLWCWGLDNADIMVLGIRQCSHYGAGD